MNLYYYYFISLFVLSVSYLLSLFFLFVLLLNLCILHKHLILHFTPLSFSPKQLEEIKKEERQCCCHGACNCHVYDIRSDSDDEEEQQMNWEVLMFCCSHDNLIANFNTIKKTGKN